VELLGESVEALSEAIAELLELGTLGLLDIEEPSFGVIHIAFERELGEIWVNVDLYEPPGKISMFIPVEIESRETLVPAYKHDWLPGSGEIIYAGLTVPCLEISLTPVIGKIKPEYRYDAIIVEAGSPVELRVRDSQGRVTGMINEEIMENIPHSTYREGSVMILAPTDIYSYEVYGTGAGSYDLTLIKVGEETSVFTRTSIPTSAKVVHNYNIDWDAYTKGKKGITMQIDSDGDGTFEEIKKLGQEGAGLSWIWVVAAVSGLVGVLVGAFIVRRRTSNKPVT